MGKELLAQHEGPVLAAGAAARASLANKEQGGRSLQETPSLGSTHGCCPRHFCPTRCWEGKSLLNKKLQRK